MKSPKRFFLLVVILAIVPGCDRLDQLLWQPVVTPAQWCQAMPCVELFSSGVILTQPTSTGLVYLLGILWLWAAWQFRQRARGSRSSAWWSLSLVLGGIAALSAGTSYQAFGYELKCAGREFCLWTSWWEVVYLVLNVASLNAMLVAVAYACSTDRLRKSLIAYACAATLAHLSVTLRGIILTERFLISFEMLVLFSTPASLGVLILNGWRYRALRSKLDLALLGAWALLLVANILYFAYLNLGFTQALWDRGIWFSENDVLHVLVIVWVIYLGLVVAPLVEDTH